MPAPTNARWVTSQRCAPFMDVYATTEAEGHTSWNQVEQAFLLMMGIPKHINSPRQKESGRPGSADIDKRVKVLAFKCIDLKGEFSRRQTMTGTAPRTGGPGGGDSTTWLRSVGPKIYFFIAVRVISDSDFERTLKWASTAQQVLDTVGLFCFEPIGDSFADYRKREGIPPDLQLERVLYKSCVDLQAIGWCRFHRGC